MLIVVSSMFWFRRILAEDIEEDEDAIEDDNEIDEDLCAISIVEIPASVKSS